MLQAFSAYSVNIHSAPLSFLDNFEAFLKTAPSSSFLSCSTLKHQFPPSFFFFILLNIASLSKHTYFLSLISWWLLKTPNRHLQAAIKLFHQICPENHTNTTFLKPKSLPHLPNLSSWLKIVLSLNASYKTALSLIPLPSHIQQLYFISPSQKCLLYLSPLFNFCCFCLSSNLYHIYTFPASPFSNLFCCHNYLVRLPTTPSKSAMFYLHWTTLKFLTHFLGFLSIQ